MPPLFVLMVGQRMFPIIIFYLFEFTIMPEKLDESLIWNKSYGLLYFNAMKLLYTNNMLQELPSISLEDQVCEGCIFWKATQIAISTWSKLESMRTT